MDGKYQDVFFAKFLDKFLRDIQYLKEETLYKILWSFIKANRLVIREDAFEWQQVREAIKKKAKDLSPKILTDVLVLSTVAKEYEASAKAQHGVDFWDSMEPFVILKMKEMELEGLINLMWSALEVEKGSPAFF